MGKTPDLSGENLNWARTQFTTYYQSQRVAPPSRFARREFAAFPFATTPLMRRHESFHTREAFESFLRREVPRHVYYSSAYYRIPDAPTMAAKDWLGADLIFDLDADHLRQARYQDYASQLRLVRDKVQDLWDDFLIGDFGVDPAQAHIVFSGGRGYHVHVQDSRFLGLSSPERREVVDYILGTGFDPRLAILESTESSLGRESVSFSRDGPAAVEPAGVRSRRVRGFQRLYPPEAPGWRGRMTRALLRLLQRWQEAGATRARAELEGSGVTPAKARRLAKVLITEGRGQKIREGLSLDVFPGEIDQDLLETVLRFAAIELQGETDAPVTTDIHRLIRLPGSLHGGTGFRVTTIAREKLERFDPFAEAIYRSSNDQRVTVELQETVDYPFDPSAEGRQGQQRELPLPVALFLILRGEALLPS